MAAESAPPRGPGSALARACAALKVFPLPGVVLLPGGPAPFRLFEPRYRALAAAALGGDRVIAVATLADPDRAAEERPPLLPIAGAGVIVAEQANGDGTFDLVVHAAARVRLVEELERGAPFREFRAELLEDAYPAAGATPLRGDVEAIGQLVFELAGLLPAESGAGRLAEAVARMHDPGAIADLVAAAAVSEPGPRYRIMETVAVEERLRLVKEEIAGVVLLLSQGRGPRA